MTAIARTQPVGLRKWTDQPVATRVVVYQEPARTLGPVDEAGIIASMGSHGGDPVTVGLPAGSDATMVQLFRGVGHRVMAMLHAVTGGAR